MNYYYFCRKIFVNYLGWKITEYYSSFTTINLMKIRENFLQENDDEKSDLIKEERLSAEDANPNSTKIKAMADEFDQVSSNLKEICSKQTIIEFQIPIYYVFKNNFLTHSYDKFHDLLKSIVHLMERKLENSIWSDDALTRKLSEKLSSITVSEILERSPKKIFCYDNHRLSEEKSFVKSVIHIESFNHLNDLCIQAYQKEVRKRFNSEKNRNFGTCSFKF